MDRALDSQEEASTSASQPESTNSTSSSQPQANRRSHQEYDTQPITTTPNKRAKMSFFKLPKKPMDEAASKSQLIVRFYDPNIGARDSLGRTQTEILQWSDAKLESSHNYIQMLFPLPEGSPYNNEAPVIDLNVMQAFRSRVELRQQLRLSFERMLTFYGFRVSEMSEVEIKQTLHEFDAKVHKLTAIISADPLHEIASEVARQKTVDTGFRTAATREEAEQPKTDTYTDAPIDADSSSKDAEQDVASSDLPPYHIIRSPDWSKHFKNWAVSFDHNHLRITRILRSLRVLGLQTEYNAFFAALERVFNDPDIHISDRSMGYWKLAVTRPLYLAPDGNKCKWLEGWEKEQECLKMADQQQLRNARDGIQKKKSVRFDKDMEKPETE
ncbi:hypothetical protein CFE70_004113 [Pyrenophora teres f. teres 0-1]|uniref:Opioid growth factor receptor (OGFr) conserved domain-containing protein n=2 Tax=Pyrenophora teres f. teres TaxID=97479 RepID=E3S2C4_PYRTT|nr:hypothetical protein PTT_16447 [Pyrenophora teres f. teres 0-1]KAE8864664.1 hypothetical protein PTNB29_04628 [Pyrenophora teres f. teres]CAE7030303.1 Opioid growth factor receptor region [Pyrenophora teres f. teres]